MTIQEQSYRKERSKPRLGMGDFVREVDHEAIGMVVHIMKCGLIVVRWPSSREGIAYDADDLVRVSYG
jgi:hypothetical protein